LCFNVIHIGEAIGDLGLKLLVRYLKKMKKLKFLGLNRNNIGPHGAKVLFMALRLHGSLEELYLEGKKSHLIALKRKKKPDKH